MHREREKKGGAWRKIDQSDYIEKERKMGKDTGEIREEQQPKEMSRQKETSNKMIDIIPFHGALNLDPPFPLSLSLSVFLCASRICRNLHKGSTILQKYGWGVVPCFRRAHLNRSCSVIDRDEVLKDRQRDVVIVF